MQMPEFQFSGLSGVDVLGAHVLRVRALAPDHADFLVFGFGRRVRIRDYRRRTLRHLDAFLDGANTGLFATVFSQPAKVNVRARLPFGVRIDLHEAGAGDCETRLLIAAGLESRLSGPDCRFRMVEAVEGGSFAAIALVDTLPRAERSGVVPGIGGAAAQRNVLTVA